MAKPFKHTLLSVADVGACSVFLIAMLSLIVLYVLGIYLLILFVVGKFQLQGTNSWLAVGGVAVPAIVFWQFVGLKWWKKGVQKLPEISAFFDKLKANIPDS